MLIPASRHWSAPPSAPLQAARSFCVGLCHAPAKKIEEFMLERLARISQKKPALSSVPLADLLLNKSAILKIRQHPPKRLLGDVKQPQQPRNSQPRLARHEIQRAVMRAAIGRTGELVVSALDQAGIAEIQKLDAAANLGLAKKQR